MKKIAYLLFVVIAFAACKDKTKFTIDGKFKNTGTDTKVLLYGMGAANMQVLDSTVLSAKGEFKFTGVSVESNFFRVNIGENEYMIIAKNGDNLTLDADLADKDHAYKLTGAEDAEKLNEFNTLKFKHTSIIDKIKADFEKKVADNPDSRDALVEEITPKYTKAVNDLNADVTKFALANSNSLISFYAISLVNPTGNEDAMVTYAEKVGEDLKKNTAVKTFVDRMIKFKAVQVGQQAPDFNIAGLDGKTINLSDYKGKFVLIDFWASWCAPCRNENPNVVKAYNTFKNRNFTILGISLDKDKAAWQQAIKQDNLTWSHASELADFEGATVLKYQVEAIPASFLIDPNGKIVAKNLRGEELDQFLDKTLPK